MPPSPRPTTAATAQRPPELLAPAGDESSLQAAIAAGADAVYFGLREGFNARAKAGNFSIDTVADVMRALRRRGMRGYATLNTLVFADELPRLERLARKLAEAGVDAVLVQDLGAARLLGAVCPELPLHASTQMTLSSAECVEAACALGIRRVVLPRELAIAEIRSIAKRAPARGGVEIEVFVHGALCVCFSGQCLASWNRTGRSANRGICSQFCRLPYESRAGGAPRTPPAGPYLLSPRDLAAFDLVPELMAAGVSAMKIEGRMKSAEYVALVTHCYRRAIDAAVAGQPWQLAPEERAELETTFSRGFSHGWLKGPNPTLIDAALSSHRGSLLGVVERSAYGRVRVRLAAPVARGDGVVFDGDRAAGSEQGGRVFEIFLEERPLTEAAAGLAVEIAFAHGQIDFAQIEPGQKLWKTDAPRLERAIRQRARRAAVDRRFPLDLHVSAATGGRLRIQVRIAGGVSCEVLSDEPLARATKHALHEDLLREQLGRLGKTAFRLETLTAEITGEPMVPLSVLGDMRRRLVAALEGAIAQPPRTLADEGALERLRANDRPAQSASGVPIIGTSSAQRGNDPRSQSAGCVARDASALNVLCRTLEQVQAARAVTRGEIMLDLFTSTDTARAAALLRGDGRRLVIASPRVHRPGGPALPEPMESLRPDAVLARNLAAFARARELGCGVIADYSLNAVNDLAVAWLLKQGADRVTVAYEVSARRLADLTRQFSPRQLEVIVAAHRPVMHTAAELPMATDAAGIASLAALGIVQQRFGDRFGNEYIAIGGSGPHRDIFTSSICKFELPATGDSCGNDCQARVELLLEDAAATIDLITIYGTAGAAVTGGAKVARSRSASKLPPLGGT